MSEPIVVEEIYAVGVETVWNAITNKDEMKKWFFEQIEEFEPTVGFETEFGVHFEGQTYVHQWKVLEVSPPHRITYQWLYGGIEGVSAVTWEVAEVPEGTKLTLSHAGNETFPQDGAFTRDACRGGWEYFLKQSLKAYFEPTAE